LNKQTPRGAGKGRYRSALSRRLLAQYLVALVLWAVGLTALGLLGWSVCNAIIWQPTNPIYWVLQWVREYVLLVYGGLLAGGWVAESYYFLSRPLRYLDEIVEGAKRLAQPGEALVELPADLKDIQDDMNLAKQQALQAEAAAREAEQRKNDLIVYLAHDLKTPLTSVIGYLTLLRDEPEISAATRARYTGIALDKALRLEDLLNEFFEITRFNLTHLELETAPVDLALMLRQVAAEFGPMLAEKKLECSLELPETLPYNCDPDKLARVFDNLLRNAVNYSFEGGTVAVRAEAGPTGVTLCFQNPGPTIPPEKLDRIFERFFRLDASRGSASGGAGLGLAIAKQIVELHGGRITAQSGNEQVEFAVTLPPQENRKILE